jgi:hypothetical protein
MTLASLCVAPAGYADTIDTWQVSFRGKALAAEKAPKEGLSTYSIRQPIRPTDTLQIAFLSCMQCAGCTYAYHLMQPPLYTVASGAGPGTSQPVPLSLRALAHWKKATLDVYMERIDADGMKRRQLVFKLRLL